MKRIIEWSKWFEGSNFIVTFILSMMLPVIWWIITAYCFGLSEGKYEGNCKYQEECKNEGKYKCKFEDEDEMGKVHPLDWFGLVLAVIIWTYWVSRIIWPR